MVYRKLAVLGLSIAAACASVPGKVTPSTTSRAAATTRVAHAQWSYELAGGVLPANNAPVMSAGTFALIGNGEMLSGNARNGMRWRRSGLYTSAVIANEAVFVINAAGVVTRLRASNGETLWRSSAVCGDEAGQHYLQHIDQDLVVGCASGRLVRLRAHDGKMLARSVGFPVNHYVDIGALPEHTLAVYGWASGAYLRYYLAIVDRERLKPVAPEREDTTLLGTIGSNAILNDMCCMGRPGVYRPATILRMTLPTGRMSQPVDLRPDPQLFPADQRPIGQDAVAALINDQLYLAVPPMLYDYGYPGLLASTPHRVLDTLDRLPVFLADGCLYVRIHTDSGMLVDELLDLRGTPARIIWSRPTTNPPTDPIYNAPSAPHVVAVFEHSRISSTRFIRTPDGATIVTHDRCGLFASDDQHVVAVCSNTTGVHHKLHLEGFTFPQ